MRVLVLLHESQSRLVRIIRYGSLAALHLDEMNVESVELLQPLNSRLRTRFLNGQDVDDPR